MLETEPNMRFLEELGLREGEGQALKHYDGRSNKIALRAALVCDEKRTHLLYRAIQGYLQQNTILYLALSSDLQANGISALPHSPS